MPRKFIVKKSRSRASSGKRPKSSKRSKPVEPVVGETLRTYLKREQVYTYIDNVKRTFHKEPRIYHKFVSIIGEIQIPGKANITDLVDEIAELFDGHPDLIAGFNAFLPNNYEIEVQKDAVVLKVYDKTEDESYWNAKSRHQHGYEGAIGYIQELKQTLAYDPGLYKKFIDIISQLHSQEIREVDAVRQVVRLLVDHPHLVLGFNEFLPEDYCIHMYSKGSYTIRHPGPKGRQVTVKIEVV